MTVESRIERRKAIEIQIKEVKAQLAGVDNFNLVELERKSADWRKRLESFVYQNGGSVQNIPSERKGDYREIKNNVNQASEEFKNALDRTNTLKQQLAKLTEHLDSIEKEISLQDLLELGEKATSLEAELQMLQSAVSQEKTKTENLDSEARKSLAALTERRQNLLADLAGGESIDQQELENIEHRITKVEVQHDRHIDSIVTAKHTLSGLNRKISEKYRQLSKAEENYRLAMGDFLAQEIESAGREYAEIADQLAGAFMRTLALADLADKVGAAVNVFGPYTYQFKIPSFAVDVCRAAESGSVPGLLFQYESVVPLNVLEKEKKRLEKLGLSFSSL